MTFDRVPSFAAWRHVDARNGFEVAFLGTSKGGLRVQGQTVAVEAGEPWWVEYEIELTQDWRTRRAHVSCRSAHGKHEVTLEGDGNGNWLVNGAPAAHIQGCLDVDLESSSLTNAFPVHRLSLGVGDESDAPAAYVRALDGSVARLEQHYRRLSHTGTGQRYRYQSPAFNFECELVYDHSGLVTEYPGIAVRTD
jgi:hypothetical protein